MDLHTDLPLGQYFERRAAAQPDHDFVVYPDRGLRWSYGTFDERCDRLAKGLLAIGIGKGDHVGIWARNVPDWLTFLFATAKIGAILVTVNPVYKEHELAYVLEQSDMKALAIIDAFRDVDYLRIVRSLVPETLTQPRGHLDSARFPRLKSLVYLGPEKHRGFYAVPELLVLGDNLPDEPLRALTASLDADEVINMQYTSGTTGFPKGVMLTSRNIVNNGFYIGERQNLSPADKAVLPVPLFHCFGLVLGIMALLTHGSTAVMIESYDPLLTLAAVEKERATALYGVPTMFIAELAHPMFDLFDLTSLRTGIMAGSPCPIESMRQVIDRMHASEMTICYGLTEASPVFMQTKVDDTLERKCETVGTRHDQVEVRVVDPETGKDCPPGVPGEFLCRGYNIMKGYYRMPEATAAVIDADGWLHSGDVGTVDEDGYYRITGRIKDMIIRGGENIYPREIEEFLYTMPGVEDVQVVGVPDAKYGEVVGAFVRRSPGSPITETDVQEYARARMARYKAPAHVFFVDAYPQTASGKIQKFKLREMAKDLLGIDIGVFAGEPAGPKALGERSMLEIRWHGRGGQGAVTSSKILAQAAFLSGWPGVTAAPSFGAERRGAPVTASTRLAREPIRILSQVVRPDVVVVLDDTLLNVAHATAGLQAGGVLIVNTTRTPAELGLDGGLRVVTADVSGSAVEAGVVVGGKPMVNTAILGSIAAATSVVTLDSVEAAIADSFAPAAAEQNIRAVRLAYDRTHA
jgi:fatty-acyl-CoA synthase